MNNDLLTLDELSTVESKDDQIRSITSKNLCNLRASLKKKDATWTKDRMSEFFGVSNSTYKRWEKYGLDGLTTPFVIKYNYLLHKCQPEEVKESTGFVLEEISKLYANAVTLFKGATESVKN